MSRPEKREATSVERHPRPSPGQAPEKDAIRGLIEGAIARHEGNACDTAQDVLDSLDLSGFEIVLASRPLPAAGLSEESAEIIYAWLERAGVLMMKGTNRNFDRAIEELARLASAPSQEGEQG